MKFSVTRISASPCVDDVLQFFDIEMSVYLRIQWTSPPQMDVVDGDMYSWVVQ